MAIIEVLKYDGPIDVLIWRVPGDDLTWGTQVIVNQTQEVIFLSGGQIADVLGPGTHTLKTANIPLLKGLIKAPFGGQTPFAAEAYFINKAVHMDVKWGTTNPIPLLDPVYKVALPVRAFGQFAVRVADSRQVFTQLSAQRGEFTVEALTELYKGALMSRIKDYISRTIVDGKITLLEVSAKLDEISEGIKGKLAPDFGKFGVELVNFFVASIDVPDEYPSVQKLKAALAQKAQLDILGSGYDKMRTFDVLDKAASNEGGAGGITGMGVGLGVGLGAGGGIGNMLANAMGSINKGGAAMVKCAKCAKELAADAKFCSGCGEKIG